MQTTSPTEFESQLIRLLPNMRVWARAITKDRSAADDLVQDVAIKALVGKATFIPNSNFNAWIHRIMINNFITSTRSRRNFVSVDELVDVPVAAEQPGKVDLDRLSAEFDRLPDYLRETLRQVAIEDRSYEDIAATSGCAIGTLKSRVHRARARLRVRIEGEQRSAA